jgi:adhesin transport system membrane fusion protein
MWRSLRAGFQKIELTFGLLLTTFLVVFLIWSAIFNVDQTVKATGQVIAVSRTQVVQAVDGGVVSQILVQEGQAVKAGQPVVVFERDRSNATYEESRAKEASLSAALVRATAEAHGKPPVFGPEFKKYPEFVRAQRALYEQKKRGLEEETAVLRDSLQMAQQELDMNETLFKAGDTSQLEVMRARRQVLEVQARYQAVTNKYLQDAKAEAAKLSEDLSSSQFRVDAQKNILEHTTLVSPVDGVVKLLKVTSIGGVLRPGEELMLISPTASEYVVEAKVNPADVGLLQVGQGVRVRLDAYDYSIYGVLFGELAYISSDTLTDASAATAGSTPGPGLLSGLPGGGASALGPGGAYYRIHVSDEAASGKNFNHKLTVKNLKQGMTANVDILVGSRSVFGYITKPIFKAFTGAMSEK